MKEGRSGGTMGIVGGRNEGREGTNGLTEEGAEEGAEERRRTDVEVHTPPLLSSDGKISPRTGV